jgi:pimeloyl-ACP methyl ester carboxylesterase
MTIHYYDEGSGFPIVWVHGFPLSSAMFEPQLAIGGFRHIRVDLPGFGSTPPSDSPPSMAAYARDVIGVLDTCRIGRAVIAGFSMGGYIVMQMLRDAPERFASLILLDTRETADTDDGRAARRRQIEEVRKSGSTASVVDSMLPTMVFGDAKRPAAAKIMESATPRGVIDALEAMASRPDSSDTLRKANVPTLVVVGDRDAITPPADAERMTAMIPRAEMAPIAKAAHMANFERPEQLNPLIAAFLARHVLHHE